LERGSLQIAAGEPAIVITGSRQHPALVLLAADESLAGFALRRERVELLLEPFLGGFAGVDLLQGAQGEKGPLIDLPIPDTYRWVPASTPRGTPYNIAQLYLRLATAIRGGTAAYPDFDAAVTRHRMVDAMVHASETGQKQVL
jgi:predicted dehydrogenase